MGRGRTLWEEGREPGREVVVLGVACALTVAVVDLGMSGDRLGVFFDVAFVLLCLGLALLVRPEDFYTAAVLPPLLLVLVFGLLGTTDPGALTDPDASAVQAVIAGLADHALALTVGHALCLGCLALRHRVLTRSPRPVGNGPASGR